MAKSFTDEFLIEKNSFEATNALDIILDIDTKFFIDPALLEQCDIPEFKGAKEKVETYFANIITLLKVSKQNGDMFWRRADELLTFKEIRGTCLGYANSGTNGNAIGKKLRRMILATISVLLREGEVEPVIFELMGVFQEKIGCDRISDLITYVLKEEIINFTKRVNIEFFNAEELVLNKYNGQQILLVPKQILSPLPVAYSFDDMDVCCAVNRRVREAINAFFDFGPRKKKLKKQEIAHMLFHYAEFREEFIKSYREMQTSQYDFSSDPSGQIIWYEKSKENVSKYPMVLEQPHTEADVYDVVLKICNQFKKLIEENGLWRLLYDDKGYVKHESAAQLLFYGIADSYCTANNIDISRENNNGQGPVDFKLSVGAVNKVLVEIKLTSNSQLLHGIQTQLPIYMQQEHTKKAIYLVIENGHRKRLEELQDYYNGLDKTEKEKIKLIVIDGTPKESASRA